MRFTAPQKRLIFESYKTGQPTEAERQHFRDRAGRREKSEKFYLTKAKELAADHFGWAPDQVDQNWRELGYPLRKKFIRVASSSALTLADPQTNQSSTRKSKRGSTDLSSRLWASAFKTTS